MKRIESENNRWVFPKNISLESVADYSQLFEGLINPGDLIFDLSQTENMHSSYIGFLIHAKHILNKKGAALKLILSFTSEKILTMLNILDHFSSEISESTSKKTA